MEAKEVTREVTKEAKEGTRDGTREEVTKEEKEEVSKDRGSFPTPIGPALSAAAKDISP